MWRNLIKCEGEFQKTITLRFTRTKLTDAEYKIVYQAGLFQAGIPMVLEIYFTLNNRWIGKIVRIDSKEIISTHETERFKSAFNPLIRQKIIELKGSLVDKFDIVVFTPDDLNKINLNPSKSLKPSSKKSKKPEKPKKKYSVQKSKAPKYKNRAKGSINPQIVLGETNSNPVSLLCRHGILATDCPYCSY